MLFSPKISTFHLKVNQMFSFVHHITAKVPANDAVPCRIVLLVKLCSNIGSDILLYVVLLHCLQGTVCFAHLACGARNPDQGFSLSHLWCSNICTSTVSK
uniref:Uncharacterized protein n=1 Tax=Poecilia mexicana TaxID=48701 RepID=A0A3B3WTR0_9TELE